MYFFRAVFFFFFFNDTATTEIYTLSLHDALPICSPARSGNSSYEFLDKSGVPWVQNGTMHFYALLWSWSLLAQGAPGLSISATARCSFSLATSTSFLV